MAKDFIRITDDFMFCSVMDDEEREKIAEMFGD